MFFQVLPVPRLSGCQLHATRCVWCGWKVRIWHSPNPQLANSYFFFSSFFLSRGHPSGNTDAFCSEAGSAAADVVSAPAAGWKRSSQHPQQRRGNARELGLGKGLPEAAPTFDRVRMILWFLCWFSALYPAYLCCTLSRNRVWELYSTLKGSFGVIWLLSLLSAAMGQVLRV